MVHVDFGRGWTPSGGGCRCVETDHHLSIRQPGGGELIIAFIELDLHVGELSFERGDPLLKLVDVVGGPKSRIAPRLLTQQFGETAFEVLDSAGKAGSPVLDCKQVGLQRGSRDGGCSAWSIQGLSFESAQSFEQFAMAI